MSLRVPAPRLLPITIAVMAALLSVKSVSLVRAAVPAPAAATAAGSPPATPAATPAAPAKNAAPANAKPAPGVPPAGAVPAANAANPNDTATAVPPPAPPISDTERALLLDLRQRRNELDARAAALASREDVLAAAEKRMAQRVDELTTLQNKLEALEAERKKREDANWMGLVKLYENMKPRDAATIFNDLDMPVLLQVMDRMNERKAAPVLAAMQPDRARLVTSQLADLRKRENAVPAK